jgi:hypothetical protein
VTVTHPEPVFARFAFLFWLLSHLLGDPGNINPVQCPFALDLLPRALRLIGVIVRAFSSPCSRHQRRIVWMWTPCFLASACFSCGVTALPPSYPTPDCTPGIPAIPPIRARQIRRTGILEIVPTSIRPAGFLACLFLEGFSFNRIRCFLGDVS